jgi:iron complex transport system permease protein
MTATALDRNPAGAPAAPRVRRRRLWQNGMLTLRLFGLSTRVHVRAVLVSLVLIGIVLVGLAWSVSVGEFSIPFGDVVGELTGFGGSSKSDFIIRQLRLPRALTGLLVGAGLGISGQIFQRMVRNPLASPDILGVSSGAAAAAVFAIVALKATSGTVTLFALGGSVAAVAAIYVLAIKQGVSSYRLVLIGIGITAMLDSVVAYLLTRAELFDAQRAAVWLTGSLNGKGWEYVRPLTIALVLLSPLAFIVTRQLRTLELGDECAAGLGVGLVRSKLALTLVGAGLAAVATAAAGPVGFVALAAPLIARRLVGARCIALIPSALVGAAVMVFGDLAARRLFSPTELPVGVITAIIGAPVLLWLLIRANRIGSGG